MSKRISSVTLVLTLFFGASLASAQDNDPHGDVANGKKLFAAVGCYQCHGWAAQGGIAGPKLNPPPAFPAFLVQLRTPRQVMPPYAATVLSDAQAADIHAYLMTMPKPADPKTIKLLQ